MQHQCFIAPCLLRCLQRLLSEKAFDTTTSVEQMVHSSNLKCSEILEIIGAKRGYTTVCALHNMMHVHTESAQCSMNLFFY